MAGNQVLEWVDLDTEIKTAGLKDVRTVKHRFKVLPLTKKYYPGSFGSSRSVSLIAQFLWLCR
jgi:hypothetical protein